MLPEIKTREEAVGILKGGLGEAELKFVASLVAPIWWVEKIQSGKFKTRNGSAFFLDTGDGLFGVTAAHVVRAAEGAVARGVTSIKIGQQATFDLIDRHRLIDIDDVIDIATFQTSPAEVSALQKVVLTGSQTTWPPHPPAVGKGVYFAGFPEIETLRLSASAISLGVLPAGGIATSVSSRNVSSQIERANIVDILGNGLPPENYDFSGLSGGPMLTIVEHNGIRSFRLAGVIFSGPNTSSDDSQAIAGLEIIRARRAHFILANGTLDRMLWRELS